MSATRFVFEDDQADGARSETSIAKQGVSSNSLLVALPVIAATQSSASATIGSNKVCREVASMRPPVLSINISPEILDNDDRLIGGKSSCSGVVLKLTKTKKGKPNSDDTNISINNNNSNANDASNNSKFDYNVQVVTVVSSKYSFNQPFDFQFKQTIAKEVSNFEKFQEKLMLCGKKVCDDSGGQSNTVSAIASNYVPPRFSTMEGPMPLFSRSVMDVITVAKEQARSSSSNQTAIENASMSNAITNTNDTVDSNINSNNSNASSFNKDTIVNLSNNSFKLVVFNDFNAEVPSNQLVQFDLDHTGYITKANIPYPNPNTIYNNLIPYEDCVKFLSEAILPNPNISKGTIGLYFVKVLAVLFQCIPIMTRFTIFLHPYLHRHNNSMGLAAGATSCNFNKGPYLHTYVRYGLDIMNDHRLRIFQPIRFGLSNQELMEMKLKIWNYLGSSVSGNIRIDLNTLTIYRRKLEEQILNMTDFQKGFAMSLMCFRREIKLQVSFELISMLDDENALNLLLSSPRLDVFNERFGWIPENVSNQFRKLMVQYVKSQVDKLLSTPLSELKFIDSDTESNGTNSKISNYPDNDKDSLDILLQLIERIRRISPLLESHNNVVSFEKDSSTPYKLSQTTAVVGSSSPGNAVNNSTASLSDSDDSEGLCDEIIPSASDVRSSYFINKDVVSKNRNHGGSNTLPLENASLNYIDNNQSSSQSLPVMTQSFKAINENITAANDLALLVNSKINNSLKNTNERIDSENIVAFDVFTNDNQNYMYDDDESDYYDDEMDN